MAADTSSAAAGSSCVVDAAAAALASLIADPIWLKSADAAAGSVLHDAGVYSKNVGSGLGAQQIRLGDIQVVAGDVEIEIVLQRQRDGVVDR